MSALSSCHMAKVKSHDLRTFMYCAQTTAPPSLRLKLISCHRSPLSLSFGASIYDVRSGWGIGGSPKSRRKEQNQLICDSDEGGVKKSENFTDVMYGSPLGQLGVALKPHEFPKCYLC